MKKLFLFILSIFILSITSTYAQNKPSVATSRKDFLRGLNKFSEDTCFVQVDRKYTYQQAPNNYLNRQVYEAFKKMWEAAKQDGVKLVILSNARTFWVQRIVWNRRWDESTWAAGPGRLKSLLKYSAVPGASRHHWGTEVDLNSKSFDYWRSSTGKKAHQWLTENGPKFGFYQPYSAKGGPGSGLREFGHEEEKWHWSYYPLASKFMKEYVNLITEEDIKGFAGDKYISGLDIINTYVLGVATEPNAL